MPDSVWDAECDFYQSAADGDPVSREVAMKEGPILWLISKTTLPVHKQPSPLSRGESGLCAQYYYYFALFY